MSGTSYPLEVTALTRLKGGFFYVPNGSTVSEFPDDPNDGWQLATIFSDHAKLSGEREP